MRCRVTQHRDLGRPLKRSELGEPYTGDLQWIPDPGNNNKRFAGAYLMERVGVSGSERPMIAPLFDPFVRSITGDVMVIQGIQLVPGGIETVQVWAVEILGT